MDTYATESSYESAVQSVSTYFASSKTVLQYCTLIFFAGVIGSYIYASLTGQLHDWLYCIKDGVGCVIDIVGWAYLFLADAKNKKMAAKLFDGDWRAFATLCAIVIVAAFLSSFIAGFFSGLFGGMLSDAGLSTTLPGWFAVVSSWGRSILFFAMLLVWVRRSAA